MLFGEYLIAKKLITEAQLLESLIAQVRETPTLVEMVVELKLLERAIVLKVLTAQFMRKVEFQAACREHGVWNNDLAVRLEQETLRRRRPVGEFLLAKQFITIEALTKVLDEFVASRGTEVAAAVSPAPKPADTSRAAIEPSAPPSSQVPSVKDAIEGPLLVEYFKIVSAERLTAIRGKVEALRADGSKTTTAVGEAVNLVHGIKAAAKFVGASATVLVAERMIAVMRKAAAENESKGSRGNMKVWEFVLSGVTMIEELAAALRDNSSESGFVSNTAQSSNLEIWLSQEVALPNGSGEGLKKAS